MTFKASTSLAKGLETAEGLGKSRLPTPRQSLQLEAPCTLQRLREGWRLMGLLLGVVDRIWPCKNGQWPPARTFDAFKDYVCITTFMTMAGHEWQKCQSDLCTTCNLHRGGTGDQTYASHHMKGRAVLLGTILWAWAYRHLRTGPRAEWYPTDPPIAASPRASLKAPVPPQPPQPLPATQPVSCFRHSCNETSAGFGTETATGSPYCAINHPKWTSKREKVMKIRNQQPNV